MLEVRMVIKRRQKYENMCNYSYTCKHTYKTMKNNNKNNNNDNNNNNNNNNKNKNEKKKKMLKIL